MQAELVSCRHCGRRNRLPTIARGIPRCGNCGNPLPWITEAGDETFPEIAERATVPVLVDFWAPWCGPCRIVSPALQRLAETLAGRVKLVKVNVDEAPKLQRRFNIEAVPTLMVLRGPQIVAYRAGAPPEPSLRSWLEDALEKA
jgi:thioredoxin 2